MSDNPKRPRRRRSIEETRALMLRAATELVTRATGGTDDELIADVLAGVRVTDVVAEATEIVRADLGEKNLAPMTTGALYQVWPTQPDFQADLALHIAQLQGDVVPNPSTTSELMDEGLPLHEVLRRTIGEAFAFQREDPVFRVMLGFYQRAENPRLRSTLRESYAVFGVQARDAWSAMLRRYGLRTRPPFEVDDLATAVAALIEGLTLRWIAEPDRLRDPAGEEGWTLLTRSVIALFDAFTEADPDSEVVRKRLDHPPT
ncbi:MAG: TetR family transcriptional regulator C-terminal domain-containing protein [Thermoleophilia bacterium]